MLLVFIYTLIVYARTRTRVCEYEMFFCSTEFPPKNQQLNAWYRVYWFDYNVSMQTMRVHL